MNDVFSFRTVETDDTEKETNNINPRKAIINNSS